MKLLKSVVLWSNFLFLLAFATEAQIPFFKMHKPTSGGSQAKVELIYEDANSLLWFGSQEGLLLYDGIDFYPFIKADTTSNHVTAIYRAKNDVLWVGYEDGSIYFLKNKNLIPWQPEEGIPKVAIKGFGEDLENRFWIATYGEGIYYQENNRLYNIATEDGLLANDIYYLLIDQKGKIWVGTDGGVNIIYFTNGKKKLEQLTKEDGLRDDIVRSLLEDRNGKIWMGFYDHGFTCYDPVSRVFNNPVADWSLGVVTSLTLFENNEIWIGTDSEGLWKYSFFDQKLTPVSTEENLIGGKIYDLHRDIEGNIWVLSNTHGICSANRQFEFVKTSVGNIQTILADQHNQLWLGTNAGLFLHHLDSNGYSHFTQHLKEISLNVISLYEDNYQNLWVGTFGDGVYCYQPKSKKLRHISEADGLTNNSVLSIDGINGHAWLATLGGVTQFDITDDIQVATPQIRNFNEANGLGTNFIYKVFIDQQKRTWFATDGQGISVLENGQLTNYPYAIHQHPDKDHPDTTELKAVYSIAEDQQGHIWLSTAKEGIFEFDGEHFHHLTLKEGIRDLAITSLIADKKGEILIVHPSGVDLLTPTTRHLIYYGEEVGIKNLDPNLNAVCEDQQGNIWIANAEGLIRFTPLEEDLEIHPRTRINEVSAFLEPIDFQTVSTFSPNQNNLVFNYIGLWYTDPQTVKYRYKLDGWDRDWIIARDRQTTYSNLPPGKYSFKISSTENDAFADEPVVEYSFEILSPIWQRWWFVLLFSIILFLLFYWYQRSRDQRLQRVNVLEKEKIESQFAALKSQINPHFLFNSFNTLITIIEENPDVAVEYVEKLSDFYRSMMQYRDQEVISLQEEVILVRNYCFLLEKRFGKNLTLNLKLNGDPVFIAPLSLQLLVENAIKHNVISKSKPLTIDVAMENGEYITVTNNLQRKIGLEPSTRFGLHSLQKQYELLSNKKILVEKSETHFKVSLPIINHNQS